MNKAVLLGGLLVAAVAVIGGSFFFTRTQTVNEMEENQTTSSMNQEMNSSEQSTSLRNFLTLGGNQRCQFSDQESDVSGMVYLGEGKMRGEFRTQQGTDAQSNNLLMREDMFYFWIAGQTQGYMASQGMLDRFAQMAQTQQGASTESSSVDLDQEVEYECSPWTVESEMFELPSGVQFTDFSDLGTMLESEGGVGAGMIEGGQDQCGVCAGLPEEARAQCLAAMNCQ